MSLNSAYPPPGREDEHRRFSLLPGEVEMAAMRMNTDQYLGAAVDPRDEDALIFYWCGDVPAEITAIIARSGVTAEVRPVPYPVDVLHLHARRLVMEPSVTSAGFGHDFQSLSVVFLPGTPPAEVERLCRPIPAPLDPAVAAQFPDVHGIPVRFSRFGGPMVPL